MEHVDLAPMDSTQARQVITHEYTQVAHIAPLDFVRLWVDIARLWVYKVEAPDVATATETKGVQRGAFGYEVCQLFL